eukprot:CAMPEP_0179958380 /NCGR_PEP_ID=MMETSP0983-20121128/27995_1 /TAXON_ID=483367 /ORGANISM="non described non described, Strain CCMP 2436" /LENGTH=182 /DNA_ID=CAMNT_0021870497 /DNA_START=205 /DNA_END=754 /DNA_ORIENTATION=-
MAEATVPYIGAGRGGKGDAGAERESPPPFVFGFYPHFLELLFLVYCGSPTWRRPSPSLLDLSEELLEACGESVSRLRRARLQDDGAAALAGQVELRLQLLRRHRCDQVLLVCEEQHHCAIERVLVQQHRLRRIVIQYANEEEFAGQKDLEQVEEEQRIRGLFLAGMVLECEVSEGVLGSDSG